MTCPHAVRHALVLPENLHCRVLIVRGCSFAHRPNGWCAAGEVSSKRCPDSASISSNAPASYLQPFTHASNFCKAFLLLEAAEISRLNFDSAARGAGAHRMTLLAPPPATPQTSRTIPSTTTAL